MLAEMAGGNGRLWCAGAGEKEDYITGHRSVDVGGGVHACDMLEGHWPVHFMPD